MTQSLAIEMAPFVLADGITVEALLEASERLERDFLSKADGYLGRLLLKQEGNAWADFVFWRCAEDAAKAMRMAPSNEACGSYFKCMAAANHDDPAQGVTLFRSVRAYGSMAT